MCQMCCQSRLLCTLMLLPNVQHYIQHYIALRSRSSGSSIRSFFLSSSLASDVMIKKSILGSAHHVPTNLPSQTARYHLLLCSFSPFPHTNVSILSVHYNEIFHQILIISHNLLAQMTFLLQAKFRYNEKAINLSHIPHHTVHSRNSACGLFVRSDDAAFILVFFPTAMYVFIIPRSDYLGHKMK